jgi:hypothetical protein
MRRHRKRQLRGQRCVRIEIGGAEIEGLVQAGYLAPDMRESKEDLEFATNAFLSDWLRCV